MKIKIEYIIVLFLLVINLSFADPEPPGCVEPTNGMNVSSNVELCSGVYNLVDGIIIGANDVTVTCHSTTLNGSGSNMGINLDGSDGVTIIGCTIQNYQDGILLDDYSNYCDVSNNNIINNSRYGLNIIRSQDCIFQNNSLIHNQHGIYIYGVESVSNNFFIENDIMNNTGNGVYIFDRAHNMYFYRNNISFNSGNGILSDGRGASYLNQNNTYINNTLRYNSYNGIYFYGYTVSNILSGNVISNNLYNGLFLNSNSNSNSIVDNLIYANIQNGVIISSSSSNTFDQTTSCGNTLGGGEDYDISDIGGSNAWSNSIYDNSNPTGNSCGIGTDEDCEVYYNKTDSCDDSLIFQIWEARLTLIVNSSLINEELTDFPILVKLNSDLINYSAMQDNGEDLKFVNEDESIVLSHEIEVWNKTGESLIWVKIPEVSNITDTVFYLYYGNPYFIDIEDPEGVWTNNYTAVWHMNDKTTTTVGDSTSYTNTINKIASNNPLQTEAVIGKGQYCDGSTSRMSLSSTNLNLLDGFTNNYSISFWAKGPEHTGAGFRIIEKSGTVYPISILGVAGSGLWFAIYDGTNVPIVRNDSIFDNTWKYITFVLDIPEDVLLMYVDGEFVNSTQNTVTGTTANANIIYFCDRSDGARKWNGTLDEFRIQTSVSSPAWIKADYYSQTDELLTYIINNPSLEFISLTPVEPTTDDDLIVNATCHSIIPDDTLTVYVQMYKNGLVFGGNQSQEVNDGENTIVYTLNSSFTSPGETWLAEVWCTNGTAETPAENTTARTIDNSVPTLDALNLTPILPTTEDDLLINATCSDVDTGGTLIAYVQVYKNGALFGEVQSQEVTSGENTLIYTVDASETSSGENWSVEIWCSDGYLNSSKENTTDVLVRGYAKVNITSPSEGIEIVRGSNSAGEDPKNYVSNTLTLIAKVYDVNNNSKAVIADCSFYANEIHQGNNSTNESGHCVYTFDKTVFDIGDLELKVTAENFTNSYITQNNDNESIINTNLIKYITLLTAENYRSPGPYYLVGDAAVLKINITKGEIQKNVAEIEVSLYASNDDINPVSTVYYPGKIKYVSPGIYRSPNVIPMDFNSDNDIRWVVKVTDAVNDIRQPVSSASHSDRQVEDPTANLVVNTINENSIEGNSTVCSITLYNDEEQSSIYNNTINCSGSESNGILIQLGAKNNQLYNNIIYDAGRCIAISSNSTDNNLFYLNNLSECSRYVYNTGTNDFSTGQPAMYEPSKKSEVEYRDYLVLALNLNNDTTDKSWYNNTATNNGAVLDAEGYLGYGAEFDGDSGSISYTKNYEDFNDGEFYISFCAKKEGDMTADNRIIEMRNQTEPNPKSFYMRLGQPTNEHGIRCGFFDGENASVGFINYTLSVDFSDWHCYACGREYYNETHSNYTLYVDGELESSQINVSTNIKDAGKVTTIGDTGTGITHFVFNGTIDNVYISKTAWTSEQVSDLYTTQKFMHDNGAVLYLPFDDDENDIIYEIEGTNNGAEQKLGKSKFGYEFDTTNNITINQSFMPNEIIANETSPKIQTVCAWIYPKTFGGTNSGRIVQGTLQHNFFINNNSLDEGMRITFGYNSSQNYYTATINNSISLNEWQHVCGQWNGTNALLFRNGINLNATEDTETGAIVTLENYYIGADRFSNKDFNGTIDEVSIYKTALTEEKINDLYERGKYERGNYYPDILDKYIYDSNDDGYGDKGYDYPYNNETTTKWYGIGSDFAPITTKVDYPLTIELFSSKDAEDPSYCTNTTISPLYINISDGNGWEDIRLDTLILNYTYGATTHQANCTNISNGTTWVNISCQDAQFRFWDTAGDWNISFAGQDYGTNTISNNTENMTYNEAFHSNITGNITWGTITPGTNDNENSTAWGIENCGNALFKVNLTGNNIGSIPVNSFQISNDSTPNDVEDLTLSLSSQYYAGADDIPISTGSPSIKYFWWFLDMPTGILPGSYTGNFTISVYETE